MFEAGAIGVVAGMVLIARDALGVGSLPGAVAGVVGAAVLALGGLRVGSRYLRAHLPETLLALSPRG